MYCKANKAILYIIRCTDGWMRAHYVTYDEAVSIAEEHIDGTGLQYFIT